MLIRRKTHNKIVAQLRHTIAELREENAALKAEARGEYNESQRSHALITALLEKQLDHERALNTKLVDRLTHPSFEDPEEGEEEPAGSNFQRAALQMGLDPTDPTAVATNTLPPEVEKKFREIYNDEWQPPGGYRLPTLQDFSDAFGPRDAAANESHSEDE